MSDPGLDVPVRRIGGSGRPIGLLAAGLILLAAVAIAGRDPSPGPDASPVGASPQPAPVIACGEVPGSRCAASIRAATAAIGDGHPPIRRITAWPSLICGDDLDCPRSRLASTTSFGSVVFEFGDEGGTAWVNVLAHEPPPDDAPGEEAGDRLEGYVVRWFGGR